MSMNVKSKVNLQRFYNRKALVFVSLLFVVVLVFSGFASVFNTVSPFTSGASDVTVSNESELRNAINNAPTKKAYTITLNNDITLADSTLTIPANKDITLTSSKTTGYYKLIGTVHEISQFMVGEYSVSTITVNSEWCVDA